MKTQPYTVDISSLPRDIFLIIVDQIDPWDLIRCRLVCRSWYQAFTDLDTLQLVLKQSFPLAKEVRDILSSDTEVASKSLKLQDTDWLRLFDKVTSRYFHLVHGRPRSVEKLKLWDLPGRGLRKLWYPVSPWEYHESHPGARRAEAFDHAFWSFDDGLLVYASENARGLVLLDIEHGQECPIPFDVQGKRIRNWRLKDRALVVEWAETEPFHSLNETEKVHRHFVSCFDISATFSSDGSNRWKVVFRSEWKIHFLGLPLNERDRFFSTHTSRHYCVYFWQPNRSMYTGDELPIESLFVWDISCPSAYLPSEDPSGKLKPPDEELGPHIVARFSYRDLEYYRIRQMSTPRLMKLELDSDVRTMQIRENTCLSGQGYFDPAEKLWCSTTTTIPFVGEGPFLRQKWDGMLPPYRGNCSMETVDESVRENWYEGIMDVVDEGAEVRFCLQKTVFGGMNAINWLLLSIDAVRRRSKLSEADTALISFKGKICGDERFLIGESPNQELVLLHFDKKPA